MKIVKVAIKKQNLGSKNVYSRNALVSENFHIFYVRLCSIKSRTLIRGGRGVGETGGNLNP